MAHKAFVAGATGYTGREVVAELRRRGAECVAHVRPDSSRLEHWRAHFDELGATVDLSEWDEAALREHLAQHRPDSVFALLGTTKARAKQAAKRGGDPANESYQKVDYGLSAMLLRACRSAAPDCRFVYLSAVGVRPNPRAGDGYVGARARLEAELIDSGGPYVIARPGFISGDDRDEARPMERLAARSSDALLEAAAALGARRLRNKWHSLTGAELARALVDLALHPEADTVVADPAQLHERATASM